MTKFISKKRAQTGTEYLIIVAFVTFAIMATLVIAITMSNSTKDKLKMNEVESFVTQLINSAESVFFAGEPSKSTINLYIPEGISNITIYNGSIVIKFNSVNGENIRIFDSRVPLNGSVSTNEGTKKIILEATSDFVQVSSP
jgi:uncharacterized protein (UPF0333 family)